MDSQAIASVTVTTPRVSSGMPNNVRSATVTENVPAAVLPSMNSNQQQTDLVDIGKVTAGNQESERTIDQNSEVADKTNSSINETAAYQENSKSVEITYDRQVRESIVKYLDGDGNVVSQSPPKMYLKTMESRSSGLEGSLGSLLSAVA